MSMSKPFVCDVCSWTFTRCENLKRHKRTRHGNAAQISFECAHCHTKFARRDICKRHSSRCQGKDTEQSPPLKDDSAASYDSDTIHIQEDHILQEASPAAESPVAPSRSTRLGHQAQKQPQQPFTDPLFAEDMDMSLIDSLWPGEFADKSHTAGGHDDPVSSESVDSSSRDSEQILVESYFEHFHPSLPLLHRATFQASTAPETLLRIVTIIGSLYSVAGLSHDTASRTAERSRKLWTQGVQELDRLRSSDWRELRKTWVMQAWLLHIVYAAYAGDSAQYGEARRLLRYLVDAVRDLGLTNQAVVATMISATDGTQPYEQAWKSYIQQESLKVSLQTLLFLDHHVFSSCNMRPLLNSIEFLWELPLSSGLWEAEDALHWKLNLLEQYSDAITAGDVLEWPVALDRGLYTTASLATQSIMSDAPCPQLIETLYASPMATLAVLTNLELLVRDFTRCYYQLPPSPSDPSAYHILTQSQNRCVSAALKVLSKLIWTKLSSPDRLSLEPLWRTCDMTRRAIKLSLCKPDDLLVGGIVESSITAAMMTATHLTLGSYVAVRRSTRSLLTLRGAAEGNLAITEDLTAALAKIAGGSPSLTFTEGPWTTVICYRILLLIWRILRWAIAEIREKLDAHVASPDTAQIPRSFGACSLILNSLAETIILHHPDIGPTATKLNQLWPADAQSLSTFLHDSEKDLINLMIHVCKARPAWAIGPAMVAVVEEILPTVMSATPQDI